MARHRAKKNMHFFTPRSILSRFIECVWRLWPGLIKSLRSLLASFSKPFSLACGGLERNGRNYSHLSLLRHERRQGFSATGLFKATAWRKALFFTGFQREADSRKHENGPEGKKGKQNAKRKGLSIYLWVALIKAEKRLFIYAAERTKKRIENRLDAKNEAGKKCEKAWHYNLICLLSCSGLHSLEVPDIEARRSPSQRPPRMSKKNKVSEKSGSRNDKSNCSLSADVSWRKNVRFRKRWGRKI